MGCLALVLSFQAEARDGGLGKEKEEKERIMRGMQRIKRPPGRYLCSSITLTTPLKEIVNIYVARCQQRALCKGSGHVMRPHSRSNCFVL